MTMRLVRGCVAFGLVAVVALAGCAKSGIGADARLTFDGSGNGTHSERANCDDSGRIGGSGDVTDGTVRVRVTDVDGTQLFSQDFEGDFDLDDQTLTGDSGEWKIEATRSGNDLAGDEFQGDYQFNLVC